MSVKAMAATAVSINHPGEQSKMSVVVSGPVRANSITAKYMAFIPIKAFDFESIVLK
jgi:hypothetical protein